MDKQELLKKLEGAWTELQRSFSGLSEAELVEAGVSGSWSVKDILAHVTTWEEEALKYLPVIAAGRKPPRYRTEYGGIDAFNARMSEQKRHLPLAHVLKDMEETHDRLLAYIKVAPDELISRDTSFRRRLRADTYGHYPVHAKAISRWRAR